MIVKLKRTPGIYLVGFMGCGKTTVGELLADELGWQFCDVDREIEAEQRTTIAEIFDARGEEAFRALETEAIRKRVLKIEKGQPTVVAVGGGAFVREVNYNLLEEHGVTIWLDCPLEVIEQRVQQSEHRPLARDIERFRQYYAERLAFYARADYRIDAAAAPAEVVKAILKLPIF
ncbi:MAG TPA: shikimate kinase [Bryobacteraceae bacterium]|jgi:shikimate kinase|nr:shikimate kinase [Bryobacteraceae bacterium]